MKLQTGIQGGKGSFHEQAAIEGFDITEGIVYLRTFADVFTALNSGAIKSAVVAIGNNAYGSIPEVMNAMLTGKYCVTGETYVRVEHQLLAVRGADLKDIKEVHSQAPALGQCNNFLHKGLLDRNFTRIEQEDTAESAELVAKWADKSKAAIASTRAGQINGLEVIAANIQDDPDNITRFIRLEPIANLRSAPSDDKSTLLLTTEQVPGALFDALKPFKDHGVNISTLHSSFIPNTAFHMRFFMEISSGASNSDFTAVVKELNNLGCSVEIIGSYRSATIPVSRDRDADNE